MSYVYRRPFQTAQHRVARVEWQPQPLWAFDGVAEDWVLTEYAGTIGYYSGAAATFNGIADSLVLTENRVTLVMYSIDGGAVAARRAIKHPGWQRKQAMDQIQRERAMERSIRVALNGEEPPALKVEVPRQRTAAQMAAEMASAERAAVAKRRAVEAGVEAQRARVEIQKLQPELMQRRQRASYRVIESLLRQM